MNKLFRKSIGSAVSANKLAAAGKPPSPATVPQQLSSSPTPADAPATAPASASPSSTSTENSALRADVARLQAENDALKGQVHLLKFKVRRRPLRTRDARPIRAAARMPHWPRAAARVQMELLVDMVTLANLDCDKLEDELETATGTPGS
jgi:hypothetical protein